MEQNKKTKVLVLVEGAKTDVQLMQKLFDIYGIGSSHTIVSYNTNIYVLYQQMFSDGNPEDYDLLAVLKSHENDPLKKKLFETAYSDVLLIFDLDPHDPLFSKQKIEEMVTYFHESSDMGKLYLNYPMVESFYPMKSIPDPDYMGYTATLQELSAKKYKERVRNENRNHSFSKFAVTRAECNTVIRQNIEKGVALLTDDNKNVEVLPDSLQILRTEMRLLEETKAISVLCTCIYYVPEYNPNLIAENVAGQ